MRRLLDSLGNSLSELEFAFAVPLAQTGQSLVGSVSEVVNEKARHLRAGHQNVAHVVSGGLRRLYGVVLRHDPANNYARTNRKVRDDGLVYRPPRVVKKYVDTLGSRGSYFS